MNNKTMFQLDTVQVTHYKKAHNIMPTRGKHNQGNITVNNEQKDSENNMPLQNNIMKQNVKSDDYTQTRYGRIIRKSERLTY